MPDPDIFFPLPGQTSRPAKRICQRCPVAAECLQDAFDSSEKYGVRGGTTDTDRDKLKRKGLQAAAVQELRDRVAAWADEQAAA